MMTEQQHTDMPSGHKYFDSQKGKTGCDEVLKAVAAALTKDGVAFESIWLEQFKHS